MSVRNVRGKKTKEKLIEAALSCLSELGVHKVNFQSIADKAKLDRPLVNYYFKTKENIFNEVWDHYYQIAVESSESTIQNHDLAIDQLFGYLDISVNLFRQKKEISKVYFQLYFLAMFDDGYKSKNSMVKRRAVVRIAKMIMAGQASREFHQTLDPYLTAKMIHSSLVGILLNSDTEEQEYDLDELIHSFKLSIKKTLALKS